LKKLIIPSYLFSTLPILLVTGPFLPDLILSVTTLFVIYLVIRNKDFQLFDNFFFRSFILISFSFLISSILSDDILFSFNSSLFYFRFILFATAICFLCHQTNFLKTLFIVMCFSMLIVGIDAFWEFIFDKNILGSKTDDPARIGGLFGDELILGSYLARSLPILCGLYLYFYYENKSLEKLFYLFLVFIYVIIFLSGERTAFLLSTLFFFIYLIKYSNIKSIIIFSIAPIIFITFFFFTNPIVKDRMFESTINSIKLSYSDEKQFLPNPYDNFLKTSSNMFRDNIIFGIGPKMFRKKCSVNDYGVNTKSCSTHPHNLYFQLFAETGLVGAIIFILIYLYIFKCLYTLFKKQIKTFNPKDHISFFMITSLFINFWPLIPSGSFFNNWINVLYFLPLGIYLFSSSISKQNEK
tara:strand:- start:4414 stop:5646 length:1233 start_codon:yes stop_codon:yes gene_type:complete